MHIEYLLILCQHLEVICFPQYLHYYCKNWRWRQLVKGFINNNKCCTKNCYWIWDKLLELENWFFNSSGIRTIRTMPLSKVFSILSSQDPNIGIWYRKFSYWLLKVTNLIWLNIIWSNFRFCNHFLKVRLFPESSLHHFWNIIRCIVTKMFVL